MIAHVIEDCFSMGDCNLRLFLDIFLGKIDLIFSLRHFITTTVFKGEYDE